MRLIDADVLMDELENDRPENWTNSPGEIQEQNDWDRFMGMVSVANTIDAVPVVRCGECKHYKETNSKNGRKVCYKHLFTPHPMLPDEFCSRGERKDGEGYGAKEKCNGAQNGGSDKGSIRGGL